MLRFLIYPLLLLNLISCGGSSSSNGMLIEGTLTENGGVEHSRLIDFRHSSGERLEQVEVCALGECSTSDDQGQWGFVIGSGFNGGDVSFRIKGHGIDTDSIVSIPIGAKEVFIDFQHFAGGDVVALHITADGDTIHNEEHDEDASEDHHED